MAALHVYIVLDVVRFPPLCLDLSYNYAVMVVVGDDDVTFGAALFGAAPCGGTAPSVSTDPAADITTSEATAETC